MLRLACILAVGLSFFVAGESFGQSRTVRILYFVDANGRIVQAAPGFVTPGFVTPGFAAPSFAAPSFESSPGFAFPQVPAQQPGTIRISVTEPPRRHCFLRFLQAINPLRPVNPVFLRIR